MPDAMIQSGSVRAKLATEKQSGSLFDVSK